MDYVHRCFFCGWQRESASPTVASPSCETCGCTLRSMLASDRLPGEEPEATGPSHLTLQLLRVATMLGVLLVAFAAARTGYEQGGPGIAVAALGLAGLGSVAIAPRRA